MDMGAYDIQSRRQSPTAIALLQSFSRKTSIAVALIGGVVILGWIFDIAVLKSVLPGWVAMKANTAVGLVLGGASLWLWHWQPITGMKRRAAQTCAILVLLIGLLTLIEYGFHLNLGIDQLLFKTPINSLGDAAPGRMAVHTAFNFLLLGSALLLLNLRYSSYAPAQLFASVAFLIAFLGLLGYLYGNAYLYRIGSLTSMAIHTALAFFLLSLGILFACPDQGLISVLVSNDAGGIIAKRLLPAAIVLPPVVCWLILFGYRQNFYTAEMGICLLAIANIVVFAVLIWWNASILDAIDQRRWRKEEQLREVSVALENAVEGISRLDVQGRYITVNKAYAEMMGYKPEEMLGMEWQLTVHPEDRENMVAAYQYMLINGKVEVEARGVRKDGSVFYKQALMVNAYNQQQRFLGHHCFTKDITYRVQAETALCQAHNDIQERTAQLEQEVSERQRTELALQQMNSQLRQTQKMLQLIMDLIPQSIWWKDRDSRFLGCNRSFAQMAGMETSEEIVGKTDYDIWTKEEADFFRSVDARVIAQNQAEYSIIEPAKQEDGTVTWLETNKIPLHNEQGCVIGTLGTAQDITDRKRAEEAIKSSLREKEVLLKEIHHRVKNNLQIIESLLRLQSRYTKDKQVICMFKESQNRIKSMALIHEKLYQSEDLAKINFPEYIRSLTASLFRSYGMSAHIKLKIVLDDVRLKIDTAIPCGLIINELVANSLKHAFSENEEGEISICLQAENEDRIMLIVGDNGVGFPKNLDFRNTESLGLQLVTSLAEQLEATIELHGPGTQYILAFTDTKTDAK